MIIWGWRSLTSTMSTGPFACPECQAEANYAKKRARRFFTLYFIPVIPLNTLGEWIECARCKSSYKENVLNYRLPKSKDERFADIVKSVTYVGAMATKVDGPQSDRRVESLVAGVHAFGGKDVDAAAIRTLGASITVDLAEAKRVISEHAEELTDSGKENIFSIYYRVLSAEGPLSQAGSGFLDAVAAGLALTNAHAHGLLATLKTQATAAQ
jgi:hypothetical protein